MNISIESPCREKGTVLVVGYDVEMNADIEFCAVFREVETEGKVQLVERHVRKAANHMDCRIVDNLTAEERGCFESMLPKFYRFAELFFEIVPFDDSRLTEQVNLPMPHSP